MDYELAKQLKDAGFPQNDQKKGWVYLDVEGYDKPDLVWGVVNFPTIETLAPELSQLIEACGGLYFSLETDALKYEASPQEWEAKSSAKTASGSTPEKAVANLWLALNKK